MTTSRRIVLVGLAATWLVACSWRPPGVPQPVPPEELPPPPVIKSPERFTVVVRRILLHEGGARYTNHRADPGGPTKYGITLADVRRYLKADATADDVRRLTEEQAIEIYRAHYWDAVEGDQLPVGVDYTVADYAVNAGTGRAGRSVRRAVGLPADTWVVTSEVIAAVLKADPATLVKTINAERMRFQMGLPASFNVFKKGWRARINSVLEGSLVDVRREANPLERSFLTDQVIVPRAGRGKAILPDEEETTR